MYGFWAQYIKCMNFDKCVILYYRLELRSTECVVFFIHVALWWEAASMFIRRKPRACATIYLFLDIISGLRRQTNCGTDQTTLRVTNDENAPDSTKLTGPNWRWCSDRRRPAGTGRRPTRSRKWPAARRWSFCTRRNQTTTIIVDWYAGSHR